MNYIRCRISQTNRSWRPATWAFDNTFGSYSYIKIKISETVLLFVHFYIFV